jgi:hypothetical protein
MSDKMRRAVEFGQIDENTVGQGLTVMENQISKFEDELEYVIREKSRELKTLFEKQLGILKGQMNEAEFKYFLTTFKKRTEANLKQYRHGVGYSVLQVLEEYKTGRK